MLKPPLFAYSQPDPLNVPSPDVTLFAVPFDSTTTLQSNARNGPTLIRHASWNIREYNPRLRKELELIVVDRGDVDVVPGNVRKTLNGVESCVYDITDHCEGVIGMMGGEHTVTYGGVSALDYKKINVVQFDAHPDLDDHVYGEKWNHGTFMRRLHEKNIKSLHQLGIRATSLKEQAYVAESDNIWQNDARSLKAINGDIYITVDMDAFDPSYAPDVGSPIPNGLTPQYVEDCLYSLNGANIVGFDVVETAGDKLGGITAVLASKIIYDILCIIQRGDTSGR